MAFTRRRTAPSSDEEEKPSKRHLVTDDVDCLESLHRVMRLLSDSLESGTGSSNSLRSAKQSSTTRILHHCRRNRRTCAGPVRSEGHRRAVSPRELIPVHRVSLLCRVVRNPSRERDAVATPTVLESGSRGNTVNRGRINKIFNWRSSMDFAPFDKRGYPNSRGKQKSL